jgi:tRNA dimethylallyltransferase
LTHGLSTVPPIPAEIRENLRARLEREGAPALHAELLRRDPLCASRLRPADRARVLRALEVVEATGRSLFDWHRDGTAPLLDPAAAVRVFLIVERSELFRRIDRRLDGMIAAGAVEEVHALDARHLDPRVPAMKAHGVPWLRRYLHGEMELAEAVAQAKRDTRRYAKRQLTWFRHQLPDWRWIPADQAEEAVLAEFAPGAASEPARK